MARTKSTESTSLDHAEASPPSKKYEPTPAEQAILDKYQDRKNPVPELKVKHGDGFVKIGVDHPHNQTGTVLLMDAIGTANHSLFKGLVSQLAGLGASKSPEEIELKEIELNFAISLLQGVRPRDDVEAILATQMVATHNGTMTAARRLARAENIPQQDSAASVLNKCARTFAAQVEALKKYRATGEQNIRVQHVTVSDGGQAIVAGSMQAGGGGGYGKNDH